MISDDSSIPQTFIISPPPPEVNHKSEEACAVFDLFLPYKGRRDDAGWLHPRDAAADPFPADALGRLRLGLGFLVLHGDLKGQLLLGNDDVQIVLGLVVMTFYEQAGIPSSVQKQLNLLLPFVFISHQRLPEEIIQAGIKKDFEKPNL